VKNTDEKGAEHSTLHLKKTQLSIGMPCAQHTQSLY